MELSKIFFESVFENRTNVIYEILKFIQVLELTWTLYSPLIEREWAF